MAFLVRNGVRLYWRSDGEPGRPALLLLNSLGTDHGMWDEVVPPLLERFRVLRMDTRGHGASDAPAGNYSIPMLAEDALAVLDAAAVTRAPICGLSMGGMVAMHIAATAPERVSHLIACNTSARLPVEPWLQRAATVRENGLEAIVDAIMLRFFSEEFFGSNSPRLGTIRSQFLLQSPEGYASCCVALGYMDLWAKLRTIAAPTLIINGSEDTATTPVEHGEQIAANIPGASLVTLRAGHLSAVERPDEVARALLDFIPAPHAGAA